MEQEMLRTLGVAALVGVSGAAMAQNMYFVDDSNNNLDTLNLSTLTVSLVGNLGTGGDFGDLAYDQTTSTMYYLGGRGNNSLYTVNLGTGAASLVGSHGVNDMFALGVDGGGKMYAEDTSGNFYSMNKGTGAASLLGNNGI